MICKFWSKFDNKRFGIAFKITILVLFVVLIFNIVDITYSRYESSANMNIEANIAFFLIEPGTYNGSITLDGLEPSDEPHIYSISVKNYNNSGRTDVDLNYNISLETTTNLPLTYNVYRNEDYSSNATDILSSSNYRMDDDVYYKVYNTAQDYQFHHNADEQDYYTIVVNFPEQYKYYPDSYQGKIDLFTIIITAEQVV